MFVCLSVPIDPARSWPHDQIIPTHGVRSTRSAAQMANPTDYSRLQEGCINRLIDDVASFYSPSDPFRIVVGNYASLIGSITSNCFAMLYFWAIRCGDADAIHIPMDNQRIHRSEYTYITRHGYGIHRRPQTLETRTTLSRESVVCMMYGVYVLCSENALLNIGS